MQPFNMAEQLADLYLEWVNNYLTDRKVCGTLPVDRERRGQYTEHGHEIPPKTHRGGVEMRKFDKDSNTRTRIFGKRDFPTSTKGTQDNKARLWKKTRSEAMTFYLARI